MGTTARVPCLLQGVRRHRGRQRWEDGRQAEDGTMAAGTAERTPDERVAELEAEVARLRRELSASRWDVALPRHPGERQGLRDLHRRPDRSGHQLERQLPPTCSAGARARRKAWTAGGLHARGPRRGARAEMAQAAAEAGPRTSAGTYARMARASGAPGSWRCRSTAAPSRILKIMRRPHRAAGSRPAGRPAAEAARTGSRTPWP